MLFFRTSLVYCVFAVATWFAHTAHCFFGFGGGMGGGHGMDMNMAMNMGMEQHNMADGIHFTEHNFHPVHFFKPNFFKKPIPIIYKPIIKTVKVPVHVKVPVPYKVTQPVIVRVPYPVVKIHKKEVPVPYPVQVPIVKYIKQHVPYPVKQIVKVKEPYIVKVPVYPKEYHKEQHYQTSYEQHSPQSYEPASGYQNQKESSVDSSNGQSSSDSYNSPSSNGGAGPSVTYVAVHSGTGDYRTNSEGQKENDYGEADEGKYYQTQEHNEEYGGQAPQQHTIGQSMPSYSTNQQQQQQPQYQNEGQEDHQGNGRHVSLSSAASGQVNNQVDVVQHYQKPVSIEYQVKHLSTQTQYKTGQLMDGKSTQSYAQEGGSGSGGGHVSEHRYNSNDQMDKKK